MSAFVILRGTALKLCAERAQDAPDALYIVACLTCQAESGPVDDGPKSVQVWALDHTQQRGLTHNQFRVTAHSYWRVDPVHAPVGATPWPPVRGSLAALDAAVPDTRQPRRAGAHAKPRGRWHGRKTAPRPLADGARRLVAPLLLSVLFLAPVLSGVLPATGRGRHTSGASQTGGGV